MIKTPACFADFPKAIGLGWINSEAPGFTILNFYRADMQAGTIQEIHAFLHYVSILEIDMVWDRHFPELNAIVQETLPERTMPEGAVYPRYSVRLVFGRGAIAFAYRDVGFLAIEKKTTMMMDRQP